MIRLLVVDDHELVRIGLSHILAGYPSIHIAGEAADGETAIRLNRELKPDVVLGTKVNISPEGKADIAGFIADGEIPTRCRRHAITIDTIHRFHDCVARMQ